MIQPNPKVPLVIIIDDNVVNIKVARENLRRDGYEVMVARDGETGLERIVYRLPDLILLDVMMPGINGFETCRRLKATANARSIPVIFMTALSDTSNKLEGFDAGGVDYITKPIDPPELLARVKAHLTISTLQKRLQERNQQLEQEAAEHQQLSAHLINQQREVGMLEERERLSAELHDNLGQLLAYTNMQAQAVHEQITRNQVTQALVTLRDLIEVTQSTQEGVRQFILGLDSTLSDAEDSFVEGLERYIDEFTARYSLRVTLNLPPNLPKQSLPPHSTRHLLRIVRELLINTIKHAQAQQVQVIVNSLGDQLQVLLIDDGQGFDYEAFRQSTTHTRPHFGLQMVQDRIAQLGGRVEFRSQPNQGTTVVIYLPLITKIDDSVTGLRVLLVDDQPLFINGLRNLLQARGVTVVGEAHNGHDALTQTRKLQPDLIFMDIHMPECDGLTATQQIKAEFPDIKIIILTISADETDLANTLKAGAIGYLLKNVAADKLFESLMAAQAGTAPISPELTGKLVRQLSAPSQSTPPLTPRQLEILALIRQGLTYKEMADRLMVSQNTIKYHVKQILNQLGVNKRTEAVAQAVQHGWI
ncbi:response regulator [Anaerolineales bacterium HSG6]|nr:response regulator [Anaerolineales bacterium HSG6]